MVLSLSGTMKIPNNSSSYGNDERRIYRLISPLNTRIYLNIVDINLEYQEACLYDFIRITGLHTGNQTLCGNITDDKSYILSENNNISIEFQSDFSVTGSGMTLVWKLIDMKQCILYNVSYIWSLNYPFLYNGKLNCCEKISGPNGTRMQLTLQYANSDSSPHALMKILDGNLSLMLPKIWTADEITYMTKSNTITLCIEAHNVLNYGGFIAKYKFGK